jgi:uncharacterized protein YbjQ (UPF0145 family)
MRLFGLGGGEDDEARERARQEDEQRIQAGGIPLAAQQRLAELRGGAGPFTSTLSVAGFAHTHLAGLQPITQVMGTSFFKVGWQRMPTGWNVDAGTQELTQLSEAWNSVRVRAFDRLRQEAMLAGADAVVGVQVQRAQHDFAQDSLEMVVTGTAVRDPAHPAGEGFVATDLSVQEYVNLARAGYRPLGVVGASTVCYIVATWRTRQLERYRWSSPNTELHDFTQGVYDARELALGRVTAQAQALGAAGIVGVSIDQDIRTRKVVSDSNEREDLIITFHTLGTAIAEAGPGQPLAPTGVVGAGAR